MRTRVLAWLDLNAGDKVLLREDGKQKRPKMDWVEQTVKQVVLYRVFPTDYNDRIVSSARDWLEGKTDGQIVP